jgi:hypothetical protein
LHTYNSQLHVTITSRKITITHANLLSFLQPPSVVAWLQYSNKGYSSSPYGSKTALPNRQLRLHCSTHSFLIRAQGLLSQTDSSQSKSYVTTDGQLPSLSWCQAPIWGLRLDFYYCQTVADFLVWGALSDERTGLLQLLVTLASALIIGFESRGTRDHIFLSQIRDSPNLKGQVPVFIFTRNRVAQLYPPGTEFPFLRPLRLAGLRWRYSNPRSFPVALLLSPR